jgi:hypothetical protein
MEKTNHLLAVCRQAVDKPPQIPGKKYLTVPGKSRDMVMEAQA